MWSFYVDTSSDDDEHNTCDGLVFLCADVGAASSLLSALTDLYELRIALSHRFAPDVFTEAQNDPLAEPVALPHEPGFALWFFELCQLSAVSTGGRALPTPSPLVRLNDPFSFRLSAARRVPHGRRRLVGPSARRSPARSLHGHRRCLVSLLMGGCGLEGGLHPERAFPLWQVVPDKRTLTTFCTHHSDFS